MSTTHHMCVDIAGVLRWPDSELEMVFIGDNGSKPSVSVVRHSLEVMLSEGKRVMPFGKPCEGWSDQTGCPGHHKEDQ